MLKLFFFFCWVIRIKDSHEAGLKQTNKQKFYIFCFNIFSQNDKKVSFTGSRQAWACSLHKTL